MDDAAVQVLYRHWSHQLRDLGERKTGKCSIRVKDAFNHGFLSGATSCTPPHASSSVNTTEPQLSTISSRTKTKINSSKAKMKQANLGCYVDGEIPSPHTSCIIHHTSYIIHHTSYIIHHTSHIIHHTSYIIHHTSYIIHHTSYILRAEERGDECKELDAGPVRQSRLV